MKIITTTLYSIAVILVIAIAGLFLASMLPIPGNIEIKIVKSGSMEPAITTGSVVLVKPVSTYAIGDVITFGADTQTQIPTTHRIIGVSTEGGSTMYTTQGDANEEPDQQAVSEREIIGKVLVALPYAGFILDFARQPLGFALLIGFPAALIIIDELFAIAREIKKRRNQKGPGGGGGGSNAGHDETQVHIVHSRLFLMDDVFVPIRIWERRIRKEIPISARQYGNALTSFVAVIASVSLSFGGIGGTLSYFRDQETSSMNSFGAGEWVSALQKLALNEDSLALAATAEPLAEEEGEGSQTEGTPAEVPPTDTPKLTEQPAEAPEVFTEAGQVEVQKTPEETTGPGQTAPTEPPAGDAAETPPPPLEETPSPPAPPAESAPEPATATE